MIPTYGVNTGILALAAFWATTAVLKLFALDGVSQVIEIAIPVFKGLGKPLAIALVAAEALLTVLLILPKWRRTGTEASILLCSAFIGFNLIRIFYSIPIPCSCLGALFKTGPLEALILDLLVGTFAALLNRTQVRTLNHEIHST